MNGPLSEALAMQRAAAGQGFDWDDPAGLWAKLAEEIDELRTAETHEDRTEELGDLLFMVVNLARHLGVDPEAALGAANGKFRRRYAVIEARLDRLPPLGAPARLAEMERLWQSAKAEEKARR